MKTKKKITAAALSLSLTAFLAVPALAAELSTEGSSEAPASAAAPFSIQDYGSGQALTDDEAIALALEHAGFAQDEVDRQRTEYDRDDGLDILEVEFIIDSDEYDYGIDLNNGRIVSASYDMSDAKQYNLPTLSASLTDSEAAALVLEKLPEATDDDLWIEADRDDGRMYYEVDLIVGDVEYNFDIDADTGSIVSWDQELTDRSLYAGQNSTNTDSSVNYHHSDDHHDDDDWYEDDRYDD